MKKSNLTLDKVVTTLGAYERCAKESESLNLQQQPSPWRMVNMASVPTVPVTYATYPPMGYHMQPQYPMGVQYAFPSQHQRPVVEREVNQLSFPDPDYDDNAYLYALRAAQQPTYDFPVGFDFLNNLRVERVMDVSLNNLRHNASTPETTTEPPFLVTVEINDVIFTMEIDTGAGLTIMQERVLRRFWPNAQIKSSALRVKTWEG